MRPTLTLDEFVQALCDAWRRACTAAAQRPEDAPVDAGLAGALADVVGKRHVGLAGLEVAFACRLRPHAGGWQVDLVGAGRHLPWQAPVHRVQIVLRAADPPHGEVRFDGEPWYAIDAPAESASP